MCARVCVCNRGLKRIKLKGCGCRMVAVSKRQFKNPQQHRKTFYFLLGNNRRRKKNAWARIFLFKVYIFLASFVIRFFLLN